MKVQKFVIGYVMALALLLFAQQRPTATQASGFREVVDLTHSLSTPAVATSHKSPYQFQTLSLSEKTDSSARSSAEQFATRIDAPSSLGRGQWAVDQIPAGRLIGPLVVLDVSSSVKRNSDYEISVQDIARWEQSNGPIPLGAIVIARTGWGSRWNSVKKYSNADAKGGMHFPGYSEDAARFLSEGRNALGLGIDTA